MDFLARDSCKIVEAIPPAIIIIHTFSLLDKNRV